MRSTELKALIRQYESDITTLQKYISLSRRLHIAKAVQFSSLVRELEHHQLVRWPDNYFAGTPYSKLFSPEYNLVPHVPVTTAVRALTVLVEFTALELGFDGLPEPVPERKRRWTLELGRVFSRRYRRRLRELQADYAELYHEAKRLRETDEVDVYTVLPCYAEFCARARAAFQAMTVGELARLGIERDATTHAERAHSVTPSPATGSSSSGGSVDTPNHNRWRVTSSLLVPSDSTSSEQSRTSQEFEDEPFRRPCSVAVDHPRIRPSALRESNTARLSLPASWSPTENARARRVYRIVEEGFVRSLLSKHELEE